MAGGETLGFGALLRRYRTAAGLTQEQLAERARLSVRAIADLERGARLTPRKVTFDLLAEALGLSPQVRATFAASARRPGPTGAQNRDAATARTSDGGMPFVGRIRERALLDRHLACEGPPVVLLVGEPGIGKSRLLRETAGRALQAGWTVLEGGCQRRGGQEPYEPVLEALERFIQQRSPAQLQTDLHGCAWLGRLLPELVDAGEGVLPRPTVVDLPPEQERRLMIKAVAHFLANIAGPSGTLLMLDDLQWAGSDALDLLIALVRSAPAPPVRVVGAYRQTEIRLRDPLTVTITDLAHAELATQIALGPLATEEATRLLDALLAGRESVTAALRERLVQRTGAVPFFLVSCARGLRSGALHGMSAESIPWDLAQSIRQRMAALDESTQALLGVAAVIGRRIPYALLLTVVARAEEEVLNELETVCRAHLLEEEGPDAYRFSHDIIREVLEADLGAGRRAIVHWRIAQALERSAGEDQVERLAYHYARSGAQDKAVTYLEQAGQRAQARFANAAAEGYYQDLVDLLDTMGRTLESARAREQLAAVLRTTARYDPAMAVLERAAQTYSASRDPDGFGRVMARLGRLYVMRLRAEEGFQCLQPLLASVDAGGASAGLAAMEAALAHICFATSRYTEQLAAAGRAANLARVLGHDRILAEAEDRRGLALLMLSRVDEAHRVLEEARQVAEAVGDLDSLRRALTNLSTIHRDRGEFTSARLHLERALAIADQQGDPAQIATLTSHRSALDFFQGEWASARADSDRAVQMSRQIGSSWAIMEPLVHRAQLLLATGSPESARRDLEEALALWGTGDLHRLRRAHGLLAVCELGAGQVATASARLLSLLDRFALEEWDVIALLPILARAHLASGDLAQAEAILVQAFSRARSGNHRLALAAALQVRVLLAARRGQWADAEHALEEGLALARSMPWPYAEGSFLQLYGSVHMQKGEPGTAGERLIQARTIFRRLGARGDSERVERDLATL